MQFSASNQEEEQYKMQLLNTGVDSKRIRYNKSIDLYHYLGLARIRFIQLDMMLNYCIITI